MKSLALYILRRLATAIVQLFGVTAAIFTLMRLLPADPVARLVGLFSTKEAYLMAQHKLGLDRPFLVQFVSYFSDVLHGSLGTSWVTGRLVFDEILQFFPITLELIVLAFIVALVIALPVGILVALRPGGTADKVVMAYGMFAGSQPEFWWGLMFIYVGYFLLRWFPAPLGRIDPQIILPPQVTGMILVDSLLAGNMASFTSAIGHLFLPVLTLAFVLTGPIVKMARKSAEAVLQSEYITYSRAMGVKESIVGRYALRNALAPVITLTGILFGFELSGAVLVEQVFSLGGLGQYAVRSVLSYDYPAIQAVVLVITAFSLFIYLVIDLIYVAIDPRVKL